MCKVQLQQTLNFKKLVLNQPYYKRITNSSNNKGATQLFFGCYFDCFKKPKMLICVATNFDILR